MSFIEQIRPILLSDCSEFAPRNGGVVLYLQTYKSYVYNYAVPHVSTAESFLHLTDERQRK